VLEALAAAMRVGTVVLWWYVGTASVAVGSVVAGAALGRVRRG